MPLILLTGFPCSGKSTVSTRLLDYLEQCKDPKPSVIVISDAVNTNFTRQIYENVSKEKEQRGFIRSEVQKCLTKDSIVICDSLNYIKGYRYELFCIAKLVKTTYCVIQCDITPQVVHWLNDQKLRSERYSTELLDALIMRYEPPEEKNWWDSPLFTVSITEENGPSEVSLPSEEIGRAIFEGKTLPPNLSTHTMPLASTNFLYELDKTTQEIVQSVIGQQKTALPGDWLNVPGTNERIELKNQWSLAELSRFRRQFMVYTKTHPVEGTQKLASLFVSFINNRNT